MLKFLRRIFLKNPDNWKYWIIIALFFKGVVFLLLISKDDYNPFEGFWGAVSGDTYHYLKPIENLIITCSYDPDFRMPGYGIFYLPLFYLFSKATALNILILLQYLFASISVYLLALISKKIFKSHSLFYLTFYLYLISTYSNIYDSILLTESFTTSFLIFLIYFFLKWKEEGTNFYLIISGICITEVVFLKPVFLPVIILFILLIITNRAYSKKFIGKSIFLFLLPFLIIDGLWIYRNYLQYQKIIPLTSSVIYPVSKNSIFYLAMKFTQSWGGSIVYWDSTSEMRWLGIGEINPRKLPATQIPSIIYTTQFNEDSLIALREGIIIDQTDSAMSAVEKQAFADKIKDRLYRYTNSIKNEKRWLYYIVAPILLTKKFFIHSGTNNLFNKSNDELNLLEYAVKIFYSLFYFTTIMFGFLGLLLLIKKSYPINPISLITGIVAYVSIVYPIIFRFCEPRYFIPVWPFLIICESYCIFWFYYYFKNIKIMKNH